MRFIGNYARSGTTILEELGAEHVRTGNPILYTSADSVLQIAAHEEVVPLERLYDICRVARRHADQFRIGRVIARPFLGDRGKLPAHRTPSRFLDEAATDDLGCDSRAWTRRSSASEKSATSSRVRASRNRFRPHRTSKAWRKLTSCGARTDDGLLFANLVDFDMLLRTSTRCRRLCAMLWRNSITG